MSARKLFRGSAIGILVGLILQAHAVWGDPCREAKLLFNQSLKVRSVAQELRLLKKAQRLCKDPAVLGPILNNIGNIYEEQGRLSKAFWYYKRAISIKPDQAITYFGAAGIYLKLGDAYSAYLVYQRGLKYDSANEMARAAARAREQYQREIMVYFPFDSARLTQSARRRLDLFLKGLNGHRPIGRDSDLSCNCVIQVAGYTCDLGPRAYNKALALRRAKAVIAYMKPRLRGRHVSFKAVSFGEEMPLIDARDRIARRLNRRAKISLKRTAPTELNPKSEIFSTSERD